MNDKRTYFTIINNDAQDVILHIGRSNSAGILIDAQGGHLTLPHGVLGPLYITEEGGGAASITIISSVDEEAGATIDPPV